MYWALAAFLDNRGEPSLARYLRGEIGAQKPLERMAKLNLLIAALATGDYVLCFDDVQIAQDVPDIAYFFKTHSPALCGTEAAPARHLHPDGPRRAARFGIPRRARHCAGSPEDATAQFLADRNVALPRELTQQLWQHTEGNPKLLELSASNLAGLSAEAATGLHRLTGAAG